MNSAHVTGKEANWFANWRISIVWLAPENQQLAAITNYHHWYLNQFTVAHGPTLCATLTVAVQAASKTPELGWLGAMAGGWKRWSSNHDLSQSQSQSFESMWNCCIMLYRHKWYSNHISWSFYMFLPQRCIVGCHELVFITEMIWKWVLKHRQGSHGFPHFLHHVSAASPLKS